MIEFQKEGIKDSKGEPIARSQISTCLGKLEKDGYIERTFTGAGSVPHRYKAKENINEVLA